MDHGSHTFYLAFEWLGALPLAITAKMSHLGAFDTEDNVTATLTFPTGIAVCQLTWNAGMRRVIYTIHGEQGAIRVEDDEVQVVCGGDVERLSIPSQWMDASHAGWYRSLLDDFARAVRAGEFVGREAHEAYMCVKLIETAYASARNGSREVLLAAEALPLTAGAAG
jgi:predicted dehydrogenase